LVSIFKLERVLRSTAEWAPFRAFLRQQRCRLESPMENLTEETAMDRFHSNLRVNLASSNAKYRRQSPRRNGRAGAAGNLELR
jgi:hypothetical protein